MESINEIQIASIETISASLSYVALMLEIEGVLGIRYIIHVVIFNHFHLSNNYRCLLVCICVLSVCPCFTGVRYEYVIVMAMFACCQAFKTAFESTTAIVIETSSFLCLHSSIHNFLQCGIDCNLNLKPFSVHGICLYLYPIKLFIISIFFYD
jgi:hypothetical protein